MILTHKENELFRRFKLFDGPKRSCHLLLCTDKAKTLVEKDLIENLGHNLYGLTWLGIQYKDGDKPYVVERAEPQFNIDTGDAHYLKTVAKSIEHPFDKMSGIDINTDDHEVVSMTINELIRRENIRNGYE